MKISVRRVTGVVTLLVSLACCGLSPVQAQTRVSADRRLPSDVYIYFSVPSAAQLTERFKASSMGKLLTDTAFAEFRRQIEDGLKQVSARLKQQTGLTLKELLSIPTGEVALAVMKSSRSMPTVVLFLDFGKNGSAVNKVLKLAEQRLQNDGVQTKKSTYRNTEIVVYQPPAGANIEGPLSEMEFCRCIKESTLVLATQVDGLKTVLDRWDGKHEETFAGNAVYRYVRQRTRLGDRPPAMVWYIDPLGLLNAALFSNPNAPPQVRTAATMLQLLGISQFKGMGGTADIALGEYDSVSKTLLYVQQPPGAVFNLFRFPAVAQQPPKWVPAHVASYMAANWNVQQAYQAASLLYGTFSLGGQQALDTLLDNLAKAEGGPKIHLKKDVLDQLTGRIHVMTDLADPKDPASLRLVGAFGVKNEAKIKTVLKKLAKLPNFPGESRQFREHTIYEIKLDNVVGNAGSGLNQVAFCVARGHLFLTNNPKFLETVIAGNFPSPSLADTKDFKRLVAKIPAKISLLGYQKGNAQLKPVYEQLRSGVLNPGVPGIDFSKLPPFSALEKYLAPSISYAVPDERGVLMHSFSLKPQP